MKQNKNQRSKCKEAPFRNKEEAEKEKKKMAKYLGVPEHLIKYRRCRKCGYLHFEKMKEYQVKRVEEIVDKKKGE